MTRKDDYYNRAKQQGYRARSAYKLRQLDDDAGLFGPGNVVVDLGAAPGGWLQVAAERVGEDGIVIGVDRQRIDPLDDAEARVELIRGDITEERTREEIREIAAEIDDDTSGGPVDVVLSDMAPNMTGEYDLDHARSVHLASQAADTARELLASGGDLAVKVFDGRDLDDFRSGLDDDFEYVRTIRPDATRDASSEVYLVGKGFLTAPVRPGDELDVEIETVGDEGDGIAHVDGYTLFVSGTEAGDRVRVRVDDVKPRYGFAEPIAN